MPKSYYCYLCKNTLVGKKRFKKHAQIHFKNNRCPYCNMKTNNLSIHLAHYHLQFRRKAVLLRDLAILAKEYGNTNILYDKDLKIDNYIKSRIKKMLDKL